MTLQDVAATLRDANRHIRENKIRLWVYVAGTSVLAGQAFGIVGGLAAVCVLYTVADTAARIGARRWMRNRGLDAVPE